jgi:hypothetical protein
MVDRYAFVVLGAIELAIVAFDAGAYEVATHAALTREAYVRSRFGDLTRN